MVNKSELRANAAIAELRHQRDMLGDRAAQLAMELAESQAEVAVLNGKVATLEQALKEKTDASEQD